MSKAIAYFKSVKITGNIITITETQEPLWKGFKRSEEEQLARKKALESKKKLLQQGVITKLPPRRIDNIHRASTTVRDLINCNVNQGKNDDIFLTLTYKENMIDIKQAKNDFKNFIKRWDYIRKKELGNDWEKLKYVYVVEFQKRGAVHFHCIFFNLEKVNLKKDSDTWSLHNVWGHGNVDLQSLQNFYRKKYNPKKKKLEVTDEFIKSVDNVGAYITKYMKKEIADDRLDNSDMYGRSRGNLKEPIKIIDPVQIATLEQSLEICNKNLVYCTSYNQDYNGFTIYRQFNLLREFDNNSEKNKEKYSKIKRESKKIMNKNKIKWIKNVKV